MYYRRKILLSLLEIFDGHLKKICLQKLLLLYTKQQESPAYDFVPYKYGCFSFGANADLYAMIKHEQVSKDENTWKKETSISYLNELTPEDRKILDELKQQYGDASASELLNITYRLFPYYAMNSTILDEVLDKEEQKEVFAHKNETESFCLFTIGYEGISLEAYLNKLIKNGVKALVDVRKNAMSMKYGFNKSQLKKACEGVHIKYFHVSEVGIKSSKRKNLNTQDDYNRLFEEYKQNVLSETLEVQKDIVEILQEYNRIALTCFEADNCQCHRRPLAEYLMHHHELEHQLIHL